MPRAVWNGHISFGLVNVPVSLYPAENRTDLELHMLDSRDQSRVRYERVNEETGEEVPWDLIVRGYEYNDGNYVVLSDQELKRAAPEATKTIEIEAFVALEEIDPIYFDKPYFLEPGKKAKKGYVLLHHALQESGRVGIARVVIRTRQYIAALVARKDVLMLELLRYAQELRSSEDLDIPHGGAKANGVSVQETKIARTLIDSMTTKWDPKHYHDEYRDALMKWIDKRIASGKTASNGKVEKEEEEAEPPPTLNFMELLKKSVKTKGAASTSRSSSRSSSSRTTRKIAAPAKKVVRRRKAG